MPTPAIPTLIPMVSSNLRSYGYDEAAQTFAVQFMHGDASKVYLYRGVPPAVAKAFTDAPSKGSFFAKSIRTQFPHEVATVETKGMAAPKDPPATSEAVS
jgi:lysyl-tRNA synthetase class 2